MKQFLILMLVLVQSVSTMASLTEYSTRLKVSGVALFDVWSEIIVFAEGNNIQNIEARLNKLVSWCGNVPTKTIVEQGEQKKLVEGQINVAVESDSFNLGIGSKTFQTGLKMSVDQNQLKLECSGLNLDRDCPDGGEFVLQDDDFIFVQLKKTNEKKKNGKYRKIVTKMEVHNGGKVYQILSD